MSFEPLAFSYISKASLIPTPNLPNRSYDDHLQEMSYEYFKNRPTACQNGKNQNDTPNARLRDLLHEFSSPLNRLAY